MNPAPKLSPRARILAVVVVGWLVLAHIGALLLPVAGAGTALLIARRKWPKVGVRAYLSSRKAALPVLAGLAAAGGQIAFSNLDAPTGALAAAACAAVALSLVILTLESKIMIDIFDLVPANQRGDLNDFFAGKAAVGARADFSGLDQTKVAGYLRERVIGQDPTVNAIVSTAFRRARLMRPNKPVMTALFVGATGAGKTELSKALAAELFAGCLVRLDCAQMTDSSSVQRLIGAPPGYIDSEKGGWLCRELGRLGTGVLLFDEIEKAHPAVLKSLMGLLDEGRITEQSTGTTYSAQGFVIVLTSNAQQAEISKIAEATADDTERNRKVRDELKQAGFLPEVLARLDAIFPFAPLSRRDLAQIVGRFLSGFARDAGLELSSVDAALLIDLVAKAETMKDYGVREVIRAVENAVVDQMLSAKDRGATAVAIRVVAGQVVVEEVATGSRAGTSAR